MATDNHSDGWNLWEAIGGLRANVQRLIEGQQRTDERLDQGLKETNDRIDRKFDRLLYAVLGLTGGVIALLGGVITLLVMQIVGD